MKPYFYLFALLFLVVGCQKEELVIKDTPENSSFMQDQALVKMVQAVAAHDGRFDNLIDGADCFSINFPYTIILNGESHTINTKNDLTSLSPEDTILPVFPMNITFANYIQASIPTNEALQSLIEDCSEGTLYNERITCIDFIYPINVSLYDPDTSDFETISFDHDKDTFETIVDFASNTLAAIQYPISVTLVNGTTITIENNEVLKSTIATNMDFCE